MKHVKTLKDLAPKLAENNAKLYLVSAESAKKAKRLQSKYPEFTVLADVNGKTYG